MADHKVADRRLELQQHLENVLGCRHVYFNPPTSFRMQYPAIRYKRRRGDSKYANDKTYRYIQAYDVIVIDTNPDSTIYMDLISYFDNVEHSAKVSYENTYSADGLNHDSLTIYY